MASSQASIIAAHALRTTAGGWVPGCTFALRSAHGAGDLFAEASFGWQRAPWDGAGPAPMTIDTILHIGSMSKPICATAVMALLDDWNAMWNGLHALAAFPFTPIVPPPVPLVPPVVRHAAPDVLAPAFSDQAVAKQLVTRNVPARIEPSWGAALTWFAQSGQRGNVSLAHAVRVPLAYVSMMDRLLTIGSALTVDAPFLPLVEDHLQAGAASVGLTFHAGAHIARRLNPALPGAGGDRGITLRQLLTHDTPLRNEVPDSLLIGGVDRYHHEPCDGTRATFDLWPYLAIFLGQDADQAHPWYRNHNYRVLGAVVAACTGMGYGEWAKERLFHDARFDQVRRHPVIAGAAARYYPTPALDGGGRPTDCGGGADLPDYTDWTADGGWYAPARQLTDWMYALASGQRVAHVDGARPLLSSAALASLFSTTDKFFCGGTYDPLDGGRLASHRHNGGLSLCGGGQHGKLSVIIGPGAAVHCAYLNTNGDSGGPSADALFDGAVGALVTYL